MDEDEDYIAPEVEEDEEIDGLADAIEEEFVPDDGAAQEDDEVLSDYADENESVSEEEPDSDIEEENGKKKKRKSKRKAVTDDWKPLSMEELSIKPFKGADKYKKARVTIDQIVQSELRLTQPLSSWHFASTDDYDQFIEDREQWVYNIANHHLEAETLATLRKRLQRLKGPALPRYTEEEGLVAARKQIIANMASLQFKVDKRVKPLMNAAQPSGQGGREATLSAAILARRQLQEAARWLDTEDAVIDEEIKARQVVPETKQRGSSFVFKKPAASSSDGGFGPKPLDKPPAGAASAASSTPGKDESALATGYTHRLIQQRDNRELLTGLGM